MDQHVYVNILENVYSPVCRGRYRVFMGLPTTDLYNTLDSAFIQKKLTPIEDCYTGHLAPDVKRGTWHQDVIFNWSQKKLFYIKGIHYPVYYRDQCFQQDNDPKHTRKKKWFGDHSNNVMECPKQSPDVKKAASDIEPTSNEALWAQIKTSWENITVESVKI